MGPSLRGIARLAAFAAALLALLALSSCGNSLSGEVTSGTGKTPIPQATVEISGRTMVTDAEGRFSAEELDEGAQKVTVTVEGFEPFTTEVDVSGESTATLSLPDSELHGRVVALSPDESPLPAASVALDDVPLPLDGQGSFSAVGLPPGKYRLTAGAPGYTTKRLRITLEAGSNEHELALPLTLLASESAYLTAIQKGEEDKAYAMVEATTTAKMSQKLWRKTHGTAGRKLKAYELGKPKRLNGWTSPETGKSFRSVREVPVTLTWQSSGGGSWKEASADYWVLGKKGWEWVGSWQAPTIKSFALRGEVALGSGSVALIMHGTLTVRTASRKPMQARIACWADTTGGRREMTFTLPPPKEGTSTRTHALSWTQSTGLLNASHYLATAEVGLQGRWSKPYATDWWYEYE